MNKEQQQVIKMYEGSLRALFSQDKGTDTSYFYTVSCTLKVVLKDIFLMSEVELKEIEDKQRG